VTAKAEASHAIGESLQSMRAFLARLDQCGELLTVKAPVDADFEIAACLAETRDGPAVCFRQAIRGGRGFDAPIVGNLVNALSRFAAALDCAQHEIQARLIAAIENPLPHNVLNVAPCQETVVESPDIDALLPVPRFFERESGRYITAGAIVARDAVSGVTNLSIARVMPLGGSRAFVGIAPNHHLAVMARAARARGDKLDIAVCIGNHPAVLIAACLYLGLGDDELPIAGALLGSPLDVANCIGSELLVPAHCECVLEGKLNAAEPHEEGLVSEFHGMYEAYGAGIVATFSRLTRRRDAMFQVILPGYHPEHCLLGGVAIAAGLARAARAAVPGLAEVAVGLGGAGRLHAVVSINSPRPGEARKAMFAIWAAVNLVKQVVVVDADIDPWDSNQVEWAIATRMRADEDLVVVPGVRADRSEPLERGGVIAKLGLDATRKAAGRSDWTKAEPPEAAIVRARDLLGRELGELRSGRLRLRL
jgi:2,5-furandicarboxylate decarboxylase 1